MEKASNYMLYLSGLISESQLDELEQPSMGDAADVAPAVDFAQEQKLIAKLTTKFGEKANTYKPLLNYIRLKPDLLSLFDNLLDHVGSMTPQQYGQVEKLAQ